MCLRVWGALGRLARADFWFETRWSGGGSERLSYISPLIKLLSR